MVKWSKRLYFDNVDGSIITETGGFESSLIRYSVEYEVSIYKLLSARNRSSFDVIELEEGQYAQDFAESIGYRVNPETKMIEFLYPDPNAPVEPTPEPEYQAPLSDEMESLKQENLLLKAQNQALTERADFIEDVVAEMATRVY